MAAVIDKKCAACGERHTFYHRAFNVFDSHFDYEYTCPNTKRQVRLQMGNYDLNDVVRGAPSCSVEVTAVRKAP